MNTLQSENLAIALAFFSLSLILVPLRCVARAGSRFEFGLDDYLLWAALVMDSVVLAFFITLTCLGLGRSGDIPPSHLVKILKLQVACEEAYIVTILLVKSSILILFCRLFVNRGFRILSWVVFGVVFAWAFTSVVFVWFQCQPVSRIWDSNSPGTCRLQTAQFFSNAVPNIATDVFMLLMPVVHVWRLHASISHRISLMMVLLQGSFVVFCSIYRLVTLFGVSKVDFVATMSKPMTWASVEASSAVTSACLPTLRPLFARMFRSLRIPIFTNGESANGPAIGGASHGREPSCGAVTKLYRHYDSNLESLLRPEEDFATENIVVSPAQRGALSDDGLPLSDIRVDKQLYWEVSETPKS